MKLFRVKNRQNISFALGLIIIQYKSIEMHNTDKCSTHSSNCLWSKTVEWIREENRNDVLSLGLGVVV